jgi:microsomal epoxide hydrolase
MSVSRSRRRLITALPLAAAAAHTSAKPSFDSFQVTTSDGVRLSVLQATPPDPDPHSAVIVLVPGWCMPALIWQAQLQDFGQRFRTLAVDPRGQGESEIPAAGYEAERRAGDLRDVLAPLSRVVLVGWSLAVLDALQFVHRYGDAGLAGLVLVDNSVGEPPAPKASNFVSELRANRDVAVDRFVRSMFARPRPEPEIERIKRAALRMPLAESIALLSYPFPREHWRDIARSFAKPLCYCVTTRYLEQAHNLQRERPSTRIEWFEHAGHALFVDEPERFNRVVSEFASSV